ncbi:MAG: putative phosphatase protein [Gemmatimonadetes bacterium]|jgi:UDP-2,3-diacylglucosamine pyrophosphatase LpxH|nr:putative phosphatase protein [Gemmatimonadota bacterium]
MKTAVRENRMLVVSDIHMGNRLHRTRREFTAFVQFALDHRYSVCINGDGIDIAQLSLSLLVSDLTPSLGLFLKFWENDLRIYYTVGNHDIALEHFLTDVGRMKVVPFLSVSSGDKRIRIEHGHMYDDMFLRFPRIYYAFTLIGRLAIGISPKFYLALHAGNDAFVEFSEWGLSGFGLFGKKEAPTENWIKGERACFREGAEASGSRGFDAVLFGHTHFEGTATLSDGIKYYNTGGWFGDPYCVAIDNGRLWYGSVKELIKQGDPFPMSDDEIVSSITGMFPVQRNDGDRLNVVDRVAAGSR